MTMSSGDISLFSLNTGQDLARRIARNLGIQPAKHEEREFEDGEHKIRPLESVRHRDVYVVQSLYGTRTQSVNDQLIRLLFFIGALRDSGAGRVNAVIPYLCYARKDRRTKSRDPLTIRYVAQLLESVGIDSVAVMDVHNLAAFENAFRCQTVHLSAHRLIAEHFVAGLTGKPVTVASPDIGGVKRADAFAQVLSELGGVPVASAFMEKHRSEGVVTGDIVAGNIKGRSIVILDDLIAGGTTMKRAADAFVAHGATEVYAAATHGVFGVNASKMLAAASIKEIVITDTVVSDQALAPTVMEKTATLDISAAVAAYIQHLHRGA